MDFKAWLNETKFHNDTSMTCGHCNRKLQQKHFHTNEKHIYDRGMMFLCPCEKSRVWTNSIRSLDHFLQCVNDPAQEYRRGFCNDTFCGYCFNYLQPLKNGFLYGGRRTDRWGCETCAVNQLIIVDAERKDYEGAASTKKLFDLYKSRAAEIEPD